MPDGRPPQHSSTAADVSKIAARMGLTHEEIIALLGFNHPATSSGVDPFSNAYFISVLERENTQVDSLTSLDKSILNDKGLRAIVTRFSSDEDAFRSAYS